jgi:hypothetical protein
MGGFLEYLSLKTRWPKSGSKRTASSKERSNGDCRASRPAIACPLEVFTKKTPTYLLEDERSLPRRCPMRLSPSRYYRENDVQVDERVSEEPCG